jgi:phosphopantetheinyl transferase
MNSAWLEIRPVPVDPEALRGRVKEEEWNHAATMNPVSRRSEWLTWRAVVRERLGRDVAISYDAEGAPVVNRGHIGVSHTRGWVAVVWSPEPCAVDIELLTRNISPTTASRYISAEERTLADSVEPLFPVAVWCAKEATYKYARTPGLDFLQDLHITSSDLSAGRMGVSICEVQPLEVKLIRGNGLLLAVIAPKH